MTYQSIITIRGNGKSIVTSKKNAETISKLLEDKEIPIDHTIRIDKYHFRKGDIKSIEINPDINEAEKWNDYMAKEYDTYTRLRTELLKKGPVYLSNQLDMFTYLFKFSANKMPESTDLQLAQAIQLEFFKTNPFRIMCDPKLFKSIISMRTRRLEKFEMAFFRTTEKAVARDMDLAEIAFNKSRKH